MLNMAKKFLWFSLLFTLPARTAQKNYFPKDDFTFASYELFTLPPSSVKSKCPQKRPELSWNCNIYRLCLLSFEVIQDPSLIQCLMKVRLLREKTCDLLDCFEQPFFYSSMRDEVISNSVLVVFFFLYCSLSCIQLLKFIKFYLLWAIMTSFFVCSPGLLLSNLLLCFYQQKLIAHF